MPAGDNRDREVEAHDGVKGEIEWRCKTGEQEVSGLVVMPMAGRVAPAHGEHAVNDLLDAVLGTVAERGKVGEQSDKPKQEGDGTVSRYGEDVPDKRPAELRPNADGPG